MKASGNLIKRCHLLSCLEAAIQEEEAALLAIEKAEKEREGLWYDLRLIQANQYISSGRSKGTSSTG